MLRPSLPDFQRPPVTEVALSVQFEELNLLRAVDLGLLWQEFGVEKFPRTEEHPPVAQSLERFGVVPSPSAPQIELLNVPPIPRCFFISANGLEIIQIQPDRFTYNWRKRTDQDVYPRFETIAENFDTYVKIFTAFLQKRGIGSLKIEQAEVTYVNRVENSNASGQIDKIVSVYSGEFSDDFLKAPEEVYISLRFPIRREDQVVGRLYVDLRPSLPGIVSAPKNMTLLARGRPESSDIKDTRAFLDLARHYIVSGFASVTTGEMHKVWERTDNA